METEMQNAVMRQPQAGTSETLETRSPSYKQLVGRLILKARLACSLPALDPQELAVMMSAWEEVLRPLVPAERLEESYLKAMQDRASTFPLSSTEVCAAFKEIVAVQGPHPNITPNRMLTGDTCQKCFGTGMEEYIESGYKMCRRCDHL